LENDWVRGHTSRGHKLLVTNVHPCTFNVHTVRDPKAYSSKKHTTTEYGTFILSNSRVLAYVLPLPETSDDCTSRIEMKLRFLKHLDAKHKADSAGA